MRHWIEDADCRDQYSVIFEAGERTAIFNNDAKDPITSEERAVSSTWPRSGVYILQVITTNDDCAFLCSVGPRHTCAGLLKAHTWQPSINVALPFGVGRSSSRSRGSATWACHSLTFPPARGELFPALASDTARVVDSVCGKHNHNKYTVQL